MTESNQDGLVLVGAGGHALVVAEAADLAGFDLAGFLDDAAEPALARGVPSAPRLGSLADVGVLASNPWIMALGDIELRRKVLERVLDLARTPVSVAHPWSNIAPSSNLGFGVYIGPGAVIHTRARIDDNAIINSGAVVEHDCAVGANAHIAPGAVLGGGTRVGRDSLVGLGARVLPGVRVGDRCTIGAGSVVTADVADGQKAVGVPARLLQES